MESESYATNNDEREWPPPEEAEEVLLLIFIEISAYIDTFFGLNTYFMLCTRKSLRNMHK
jgi:hypothetical protein